MLEGASCELKPRVRLRSVKYSITHTKTSSNLMQTGCSLQKRRNHSIINPNKLEIVTNAKKSSWIQNETLESTDKKDLYLKTFLSFASKNFFKENYPNTDVTDTCAAIVNFDKEFDKKQSHFTFFDTMIKPVEYIEKVYSSSQSQLKGQKFEVIMLKSELNRIKLTTERALDEILTSVLEKVNQVKKTIQMNEVSQQQRKLRFKKDISLLRKGTALNKSMVDSLSERNIMVQEKIFDCHPLELEIRQIIALQVSDQEEE